jgi:hypothetical protein
MKIAEMARTLSWGFGWPRERVLKALDAPDWDRQLASIIFKWPATKVPKEWCRVARAVVEGQMPSDEHSSSDKSGES